MQVSVCPKTDPGFGFSDNTPTNRSMSSTDSYIEETRLTSSSLIQSPFKSLKVYTWMFELCIFRGRGGHYPSKTALSSNYRVSETHSSLVCRCTYEASPWSLPCLRAIAAKSRPRPVTCEARNSPGKDGDYLLLERHWLPRKSVASLSPGFSIVVVISSLKLFDHHSLETNPIKPTLQAFRTRL